jgi:hypothetical protein
MKASLRFLILGLLMLAPLSVARAQDPDLSPIANQSMNAGATKNVDVVAFDPAGGPVTISADPGDLPRFATLNAPLSGNGVVVTTLTLAPTAADIGNYTAAVTMTAAGGVQSVRVFQITVNAAGSNRAPIVSAPPLKDVVAGAGLNFSVTASDPDGDAITSLDASDLPAGATFVPNGANTSGSFHWTPAAGDTGQYNVTFTASNALSGAITTHIRVVPPTVGMAPIADATIVAGGSTSVPVQARVARARTSACPRRCRHSRL